MAFASGPNEWPSAILPFFTILAASERANSATAAIPAGCARPASMICSRKLLPSHFAAKAGSFCLSTSSAWRLSSELMSAIMPRVSSGDQSFR